MSQLRHRSNEQLSPEVARMQDLNVYIDQHELERIRQALQRELRVHGGQVALAQAIGIARGSLRKFLSQESTPRPTNMDRLRDWVADRPDIWTPIGAVCLGILVRDLVPAEARAPARRHLARELAAHYRRTGQVVPEWLAAEE